MRRLLAPALAAILLLAPAPSSAAERGTITGIVRNAVTGRPQAGVEVILIETSNGEARGRQRLTGKDGTFTFARLRTGREHVYTVDARFDGGLFAGGAVSLPSRTDRAPVVETKLRVWPTTTDPADVLVRRDDIFAVLDGSDIGIIESVTIVNRGARAYAGRATEGEVGETPSVGFPLPRGADSSGVSIVGSDLDIPALVPTDFGFAATVAVPPGQWKVTYTYELPGTGGSFDLSRPVLYPTLDLTVYATEPLEAESNRLEARGTQEIGGKTYGRFAAPDGLDAGDPLQVVLLARSDLSPLLLIGSAAGVATLVAAIVLVAAAARRRRRRIAGEREDLIRQIAALDLQREAGSLGEEEWIARREALKETLQSLSRGRS